MSHDFMLSRVTNLWTISVFHFPFLFQTVPFGILYPFSPPIFTLNIPYVTTQKALNSQLIDHCLNFFFLFFLLSLLIPPTLFDRLPSKVKTDISKLIKVFFFLHLFVFVEYFKNRMYFYFTYILRKYFFLCFTVNCEY